MLRKLYDWTLSLAGRPRAEYWLALIAFIESSVFLVPADVLFSAHVPGPSQARLSLCRHCHHRIGHWAASQATALATLPISSLPSPFSNSTANWRALNICASVLTTAQWPCCSSLRASHICHLSRLSPFLPVLCKSASCFSSSSSIIARGARFFALGWALQRWGEPIRNFIEKRLGLLAGAAAAVLIALYFAAKYFASSGGAAC